MSAYDDLTFIQDFDASDGDVLDISDIPTAIARGHKQADINELLSWNYAKTVDCIISQALNLINMGWEMVSKNVLSIHSHLCQPGLRAPRVQKRTAKRTKHETGYFRAQRSPR